MKMSNLIKKLGKRPNRHPTKEDIQMQVSIWNYAQHPLSLGNCKLRPKWDITIQSLEWAKSRILTTNAGQDMEQQNSHLLLMGNAKSGAMLEIVWKFLIKLNMFLPLIQITLWFLPKWTEILYSHIELHIDVYNSFISNGQNMEASMMSISKWLTIKYTGTSRQWNII